MPEKKEKCGRLTTKAGKIRMKKGLLFLFLPNGAAFSRYAAILGPAQITVPHLLSGIDYQVIN
jgi:hypothetical protein